MGKTEPLDAIWTPAVPTSAKAGWAWHQSWQDCWSRSGCRGL